MVIFYFVVISIDTRKLESVGRNRKEKCWLVQPNKSKVQIWIAVQKNSGVLQISKEKIYR